MLHTWISQKGFNYYLMASQKMIITFGLVDIIFFVIVGKIVYHPLKHTHSGHVTNDVDFFFFFENDK